MVILHSVEKSARFERERVFPRKLRGTDFTGELSVARDHFRVSHEKIRQFGRQIFQGFPVRFFVEKKNVRHSFQYRFFDPERGEKIPVPLFERNSCRQAFLFRSGRFARFGGNSEVLSENIFDRSSKKFEHMIPFSAGSTLFRAALIGAIGYDYRIKILNYALMV